MSTTTQSPKDQVAADQHKQKQLIIYRSLITWQHVSRALVTQKPPLDNQPFASKILGVLSSANNLAIRYLAHKALQNEEAVDAPTVFHVLGSVSKMNACMTFLKKECLNGRRPLPEPPERIMK